LLELEYSVGLIELSGYRLELEDLTRLKVDLGTKISKYAWPYIEKEMEIVYAK